MSAIWIIDQLEFDTLEDLWLCITISIDRGCENLSDPNYIFERRPVALYFYFYR